MNIIIALVAIVSIGVIVNVVYKTVFGSSGYEKPTSVANTVGGASGGGDSSSEEDKKFQI